MTRAERRRLERLERKKAKKRTKHDAGDAQMALMETPKQRGLVMAFFLILFSFTAFSFVVGADTWLAGGWMSLLGWSGMFLSFGVGVFLWGKNYKKFHGAKWGRYIFFIIFFGLLLGFVYTYSIGLAIEAKRWRQTKEEHPILVDAVYSWSYGERFSNQQCDTISHAQDKFIKHLWNNEIPPSSKQIDLAVYAEKVLYQSGCNGRFVLLEKLGKKGNAFWEKHYPLRDKEVRTYLNQFWPNAYDGCYLEQSRAWSNGEKFSPCSSDLLNTDVEWQGFKRN